MNLLFWKAVPNERLFGKTTELYLQGNKSVKRESRPGNVLPLAGNLKIYCPWAVFVTLCLWSETLCSKHVSKKEKRKTSQTLIKSPPLKAFTIIIPTHSSNPFARIQHDSQVTLNSTPHPSLVSSSPPPGSSLIIFLLLFIRRQEDAFVHVIVQAHQHLLVSIHCHLIHTHRNLVHTHWCLIHACRFLGHSHRILIHVLPCCVADGNLQLCQTYSDVMGMTSNKRESKEQRKSNVCVCLPVWTENNNRGSEQLHDGWSYQDYHFLLLVEPCKYLSVVLDPRILYLTCQITAPVAQRSWVVNLHLVWGEILRSPSDPVSWLLLSFHNGC